MSAHLPKPAPAPAPLSTADGEPKGWREAAALELVVRHRSAAIELSAEALGPKELIIGFGIATKLKNFADRRVTALRKEVDKLFTGENALRAIDVARFVAEQVFFGPWVKGDTTGKVIGAKLLNGAHAAKILSEEKAFALLKTKKPSAKRMVMEKPPRPAQPPPRFSPAKFRELLAKEIITQEEHDACLEDAPPRPTMTVEVPPELEAAIAMTLLRAPPASPSNG